MTTEATRSPTRDATCPASDLAGYYDELTDRYPVLLLEDGMGEDDWQGWEELTAHLGRRLELAGDDLFVTNAERLREGIAAGSPTRS